MLTPMMIQYLVGLCCLKHDPNAVDIILGDMVHDPAAAKDRDVDVTIKIKSENGDIDAFKAVEVKAENKPLDVVTIEQLCLKLMDMPEVTHKSVFSTSGYTDGAKSKAKAHSLDLYTLELWDIPIGEDLPDFEGSGSPGEFLSSVEDSLLYWINHSMTVVIPTTPTPIKFNNDTPILNSSGKKHHTYLNMYDFMNTIYTRSTGILCTKEPALTILRTFPYGIYSQYVDYLAGPAWPHTHTIDVAKDEAYLQNGDGVFRIEEITITGELQWRIKKLNPEFYILRNAFDHKKIFAGAAIADSGANDGRMFAMVFPNSGRTLGIHRVQIPEKQRNILRNLKIT